MREAGYTFHTEFVLHDMVEEEMGDHLCFHSEKMALALGCVLTKDGTPLLIRNNLRMCIDCHEATKFISKLKNRDITVRDANRFHHFHAGNCSCKNYW